MTVAELITLLEEYPDNWNVEIIQFDVQEYEIDEVYQDEKSEIVYLSV